MVSSNITNKANESGISGASELLNNAKDLLALGLGVSLSEREISIRNNALLHNWHKMNYGIDSVSLSSPTHHIEPTGIVAGSTRIGDNADVYTSEGRNGLKVEDYGGIVGYTNTQENADADNKVVKDAMFKTGIVNNKQFQQGASFINPSNFDTYDIDEKYNSLYATSSINATSSTKTVKGAYKYNGGNEDLISRKILNNTDVNDNYIMYNENAAGNLTNSNNTFVTDDVESFMEDDTESSSSLLLGEYEDTVKPRTLVMRTNELFRYGKIGSIVARFKTDSDFGATDWPTSKTAQHGMSRGRNLLKGSVDKINGYDNPYCRVWTNHYQYAKHNNLIRPFLDGEWNNGINSALKGVNGSELRKNLEGLNAHLPGDSGQCNNTNTLLADYSVLEDNGHVKITPYKDETTGEYSNDVNDQKIKRYMFSIENLAWKGYTDGLTPEQKGPNGGRIMWFPPYDLEFDESLTAHWQPHDFIGRGEKIHTYTNSDRTGTISFCILADHPSMIDAFVNHNHEDTEANEQKILRFFAGCDKDIVEPEEPEQKEKICKKNISTYKGNKVVEDRYKYVEAPEAINVVIPIFFQNNFTGVNYLDPDKIGVQFSYTENGKSKKYLFNEYIHKSATLNGTSAVTETYFKGKKISDAEKVLMENEWHTLKYAGCESKIGFINKDAVYSSLDQTSRSKHETNSETNSEGKSKLLSLEACEELMNSSLEESIGSDSFVAGKRHIYAQDSTRYSRERQRVKQLKKYGKKNLRPEYYDFITYGLNTKNFSRFYNSDIDPNKSNSSELPESGTHEYTRVSKAYKTAKIIIDLLDGHETAKCVSLEEMQDVHSLADLFKVIGADYVTSAETNTGDVVEISWKCETIDAYAGASYAGVNNQSLANLRYLFIDQLIKEHGINLEGFDINHLSKRTSMTDANGGIAVSDKNKQNGVIEDSDEDCNNIQDNINNGKYTQKATRFAAISIRLTPLVHCDKDTIVDVTDESSNDRKIYDKTTNKEYLICSREQIVRENNTGDTSETSSVCGYECVYKHSAHKEYEYFKKIKVTDPILFKNLTKKFQYFDPAFHSITPEGFNSRLTFLQQCTRQGPTKSVSENGIVSTIGAGNLAFGTPPYCIIRIGDFFYTKAIIENIRIQYSNNNGISWDLNPEGIGVQPMYAKVSLSVTFLGGSDIEAPISRLQTAISANYYANASVYDNTAMKDAHDQHEYDEARNKIKSTMYN